MLSVGIRFGNGFDRANVLKLMNSLPMSWDYDFLVLGCSVGGIACALEASSAGKKTAIVKWKNYSIAEEEGFDEDLKAMSEILKYKNTPTKLTGSGNKLDKKGTNSPNVSMGNVQKVVNKTEKDYGKSVDKKVRKSRLDLNNELYKRGNDIFLT